MSPALEAFLRSWPSDPLLAATLLLTAGVYCRGWRWLRRREKQRWHAGRAVAFCGGLATLFLALASPLEPFAGLLLQVHMVQHLLLMMVAPPLIWLGAPLLPLLHGLPAEVRAYWAAPLLRSRRLRKFFERLTHPLVAWPVYVGVAWFWHVPRFYQLALRSAGWHIVEHLSFILAALLFWYPVVRPYPSRPRWSPWLLLPYLLLADVQNTMLAAWLTFSSRVIYPHYAAGPRIGGWSALDDQAAAGVVMWVPGSIAFLLPLFAIGLKMVAGKTPRRTPAPLARRTAPISMATLLPIAALPSATAANARFDLLRLPLAGRWLRWRYARPLLRTFVGLLVAAVIVDGLFGPQLSPMNLAGVLPWVHWRGVVILGLLAAGNFFCMACPFTLPRSLVRRWRQPRRAWPRALRSKWLAAALMVTFLWSYEAFSLWDSPWLTAWIAIGYFVAALAVDATFRGAAFCKYVCPIGQFNFVQSLVSPLEVTVREPAVCASCRTKECIRGAATSPGCELELFQPRKAGNLDCTFCLDCVHACPHENVGVLAVVPGATLWSDRFRSGVGRFSRRPDLAALALALVFGAFANAAGMTAPLLAWQDSLGALLSGMPPLAMTTLFYVAALVVLPLALIGVCALASRAWGALDESPLTVGSRFAMALVPLGFGMWLAHYSFHFFTSWDAVIPVVQRFAADLGTSVLGEPAWQCACCRPAAAWVLRAELLMLGAGLLLSLYAALRIAEGRARCFSQALRAFAPWGALATLLFAVGVWILFQPMEMRGTLPADGELLMTTQLQPRTSTGDRPVLPQTSAATQRDHPAEPRAEKALAVQSSTVVQLDGQP